MLLLLPLGIDRIEFEYTLYITVGEEPRKADPAGLPNMILAVYML